jgi:integrase
MATTLTAAAVGKFKGAKQRREVRDGGAQGLHLIIQPSGAKSWALRFRRPNGKPGKLVLGPVDLSGKEASDEPKVGTPLTLAGARALTAQLHRDRARGVDIIARHKSEKDRHRDDIEDAAANAYAKVAQRYITEHVQKNIRRWREVARVLGFVFGEDGKPAAVKGGLAVRWRDLSIKSITAHQIGAVVDEARDQGIPGMDRKNDGISEARARNMHSVLSGFFGWLVERRKIEANPCAGLHRPKAPKARERVLMPNEIRWFWRATDEVGSPFGEALKLLLLVGARLNEVAGMRRDELDGAMWSLPGTRTKNKKPHLVPLPPLALAIIEDVQSAGETFVFSTTGATSVSGWSRAKERLDEKMAAVAAKEMGKPVTIPDWRLHDLRRTAATGMAELGIAPHIVEAALNHISGAKAGVAGTYNRAAYADEKRAALERWATHVEGIASGESAKVIKLRSARA